MVILGNHQRPLDQVVKLGGIFSQTGKRQLLGGINRADEPLHRLVEECSNPVDRHCQLIPFFQTKPILQEVLVRVDVVVLQLGNRRIEDLLVMIMAEVEGGGQLLAKVINLVAVVKTRCNQAEPGG